MNEVQIYVTNITSDIETNYPPIREIIADTNCYGHKEIQRKLLLSPYDYSMVAEKGYYLG